MIDHLRANSSLTRASMAMQQKIRQTTQKLEGKLNQILCAHQEQGHALALFLPLGAELTHMMTTPTNSPPPRWRRGRGGGVFAALKRAIEIAAALARLLQSAHTVDGIVKGLKQPDWPQDGWQALQRLALQVCRLTSAAR